MRYQNAIQHSFLTHLLELRWIQGMIWEALDIRNWNSALGEIKIKLSIWKPSGIYDLKWFSSAHPLGYRKASKGKSNLNALKIQVLALFIYILRSTTNVELLWCLISIL